jgi:predicted NBD/HSP70 family sugar kinase
MLAIAYMGSERRVWKFATGRDAGPDLIRERITRVMDEMGAREHTVIGVAVPGLVDGSGVVQDCDVLPRLVGWRPADDWQGTAVLNDGEAALVSVAADEPVEATVAAVGCGTGIVAALQVAGKRLRQFRPYAGELGIAPFGRQGTFDENASGSAVVRKLGLEPDEIVLRLEQGDARCATVIREAGEAFGISLVTILHLVHPEKIGLYGGTLRYRGYVDAALAALQRLAHPLLLPLCRVEVMEEAELIVAQGALRSALSERRRC